MTPTPPLRPITDDEIATFINNTGLKPIGENLYVETAASGPPLFKSMPIAKGVSLFTSKIFTNWTAIFLAVICVPSLSLCGLPAKNLA